MPERDERSRRGRRVNVTMPAQLSVGGEVISTQTENISFLGTYVKVGKEIPVGTQADVMLTLPPGPGGGSVQCDGVVVRCENLEPGFFGLGIFFKQILGEGETRLGRLIDDYLRRQNEEARRYFEERERLRKEKMKKKLAEKRRKRRKRGRPPKKGRKKTSRKRSS